MKWLQGSEHWWKWIRVCNLNAGHNGLATRPKMEINGFMYYMTNAKNRYANRHQAQQPVV
jgi:hypothetical protein